MRSMLTRYHHASAANFSCGYPRCKYLCPSDPKGSIQLSGHGNGRLSVPRLVDLGLIPSRITAKTMKLVHIASLLATQYFELELRGFDHLMIPNSSFRGW